MRDRDILLGTQLEAPEGFEQLEKGATYHFLVNAGKVRLLQLIEQPVKLQGRERPKQCRPPDEVVILELGSSKFEWALDHGVIRKCEKQAALPSRCKGLENVEVEARERTRYKKKKASHASRVEKILGHMEPLLADLKGVLTSDDPIAMVNEVARMCKPQQNEQRFRATFFTYIAFNQNRNTLAYQIQKIGKWERIGHPGARCGVKAKGLGALHGFKSTEEQLVADVRDAWYQFKQLGRSIRKLYRLTCTYKWRCKKVKDGKGRKRLVRPGGEPFLTYDQFYSRLHQLFDSATINRELRGRAWYREEKAPSLGHFSESVANIGEQVEADGYWIQEVSLAPDGVTHLPPIIVVRIICKTSGMRLGIGFSLDGEKGSAYRMAKFCAAVPKTFFCELFGMIIDPDAWPSEGMSDDMIHDRGVGSGPAGQARAANLRPVMSELTPTGFGQGKASVESTNPREITIRDRPSFVETTLPIIELIRREIRETIAWNDAHDISSRLGPRRIGAADRITPLDLYDKLTSVGRNDCRPVPVKSAIRSHLTEVKLDVKSDGVYLHFQRYDSPALRATGILDRAIDSEKPVQVTAYMLDMTIRQVWVDVDGELIQVPGKLHLREDEDQLDITYAELALLSKKLDEMTADFRTHREAVLVDAEGEWSEESGHTALETHRTFGKPNRNSEQAQEHAKVLRSYMSPRKRAA